ncbi:MAG TPA: LLM class F420-dependent oxidoreductase, partial [Galbitalea sp.]|nr:LLM class F420-dependent oxidoreductase [Galbitalea sp.]
LAATYATEYNTGFVPLDELAATMDRVRNACTLVGREPDDIIMGVPRTVAVGATEAAASSRAEASFTDLASLRRDGIAGTADEAVDRISAIQKLGVDRLYLQIVDFRDLDHLDFIAREILPKLD